MPGTGPITSFRGEDFGFLSNFYPSPLTYEGVRYRTVEHAFQAAKSLDVAERHKVALEETPAGAKKAGRKVQLRSDWEAVKVGIMEDLLRLKFQVPALRAALLATGSRELVEGNTWGDQEWGVVGGQGKNLLGQALMKVRSELGKESR